MDNQHLMYVRAAATGGTPAEHYTEAGLVATTMQGIRPGIAYGLG